MMINDRINKIIEREKLTIASFARKIDIGDQTVRSVCVMKRNRPSFEFISKIVQTFDWLNPRWLLTGEGSMEIERCEPQQQPQPQPHPVRQCDDYGSSRLMIDMLNYLRDKDSRLDQYIRDKDRKIEELLYDRAAWRLMCENMSGRLAK